MFFEIIVIIVLIILIVSQFGLWEKFKSWYARFSQGETISFKRKPRSEKNAADRYNVRSIIFLVLLALIFALFVSYFQTNREITMTANSLAIEQLVIRPEAFTEAALSNQIQIVKNSFDFNSLYWNKFFENLGLFILLPALISAAVVFVQDEMSKTKKKINAVNIDAERFLDQDKKKMDDFEVKLADNKYDELDGLF